MTPSYRRKRKSPRSRRFDLIGYGAAGGANSVVAIWSGSSGRLIPAGVFLVLSAVSFYEACSLALDESLWTSGGSTTREEEG